MKWFQNKSFLTHFGIANVHKTCYITVSLTKEHQIAQETRLKRAYWVGSNAWIWATIDISNGITWIVVQYWQKCTFSLYWNELYNFLPDQGTPLCQWNLLWIGILMCFQWVIVRKCADLTILVCVLGCVFLCYYPDTHPFYLVTHFPSSTQSTTMTLQKCIKISLHCPYPNNDMVNQSRNHPQICIINGFAYEFAPRYGSLHILYQERCCCVYTKNEPKMKKKTFPTHVHLNNFCRLSGIIARKKTIVS